MPDVNIDVLLGKTITKIEGAEKYSEEIKIFTDDGYVYTMYHDQDCCESVYVEDITGDIEGIIGRVITEAAEISQENPHASESGTWTFYKLSARHYGGGVCIRWNGESNGYYSEEVDFREEYIGGGIVTPKITPLINYAVQPKITPYTYYVVQFKRKIAFAGVELDWANVTNGGTKEELEKYAQDMSVKNPDYDFRVVEIGGSV